MRNVLLCLTGLSPQVVTETLWVLVAREKTTPDEVHVITTATGREFVLSRLLQRDTGAFHRFCAEYGIRPGKISFTEDTVHVIQGDDGPLDDIRDSGDNRRAAEAIHALVSTLASEPDTVLHASAAGGRKTMGIHLGFAMSCYGKPKDRLSHILVNEPFEGHPEFYFPPREPVELRITRMGRDAGVANTKDAVLELADIDFVRLGGLYFIAPGTPVTTPEQITRQLRDRGVLVFDTSRCTLALDGCSVKLSVDQAAVYLTLLRSRAGGLVMTAYDVHDTFMDTLEEICRAGMDLETKGQGFDDRGDNPEGQSKWFLRHASKINRRIRDVVPEHIAVRCTITHHGPRGSGEYTIPVPPENIRIT
jgi:CRISPR-associated protein (TIGR02584 family)